MPPIQWAPSLAGRGVANTIGDLYRNLVPDYPDTNVPVLLVPTMQAKPAQGPAMTSAPKNSTLGGMLLAQVEAQRKAEESKK